VRQLIFATTGDMLKADREASKFELEVAKIKARVSNDN